MFLEFARCAENVSSDRSLPEFLGLHADHYAEKVPEEATRGNGLSSQPFNDLVLQAEGLVAHEDGFSCDSSFNLTQAFEGLVDFRGEPHGS